MKTEMQFFQAAKLQWWVMQSEKHWLKQSCADLEGDLIQKPKPFKKSFFKVQIARETTLLQSKEETERVLFMLFSKSL